MSALPFVTVDVFTTTRYAGNPLAIVRIPPEQQNEITTEQMQKIAREFNLSETVFLYERSKAGNSDDGGVPEWRIRIFFPDHELPFAGHPVIGTAVYALGNLSPGAKKGRLICNAGPVELDFDPDKQITKASIPHNFHEHTEAPFTQEQVQALQPDFRALVNEVSQPDIAVVSPVKGMNFVSIEISTLAALGAMRVTGVKPKPKLDSGWNEGFAGSLYYVSTGHGDGEDRSLRYRTRMIEGSLEDPATGSASCGLGCYLALKFRGGKQTDFVFTQGVEMGRKSDIHVTVLLNDALEAVEKVYLTGSAVPVMEGKVSL